MKRHQTNITFQHGLGKSPVFGRLGIARQACSTADFWGTNHQDEPLALVPDKSFRSPAPAAAAIPDWPVNPGLCSSHATEAWWLKLPATSPFSRATSALAGRLNSLECPSRAATVTRTRRKTVFTQTQICLCACNHVENYLKTCMCEGKAERLIRSMRRCACKGSRCRQPARFSGNSRENIPPPLVNFSNP